MSGTTPTGWLLHTLAGGGLLLLLAWTWVAWTRQPARRLRVAEWAVIASLVLAVLSLGPAWLVVSTPTTAPRAAAAPSPSIDNPEAERPRGGAAPAPPARVHPPAAANPVPIVPVPRTAEPAPRQPDATRPAEPSDWSWDADRLASVGATLYLAAAVVILGRWLVGWAALSRVLRRCKPVVGRPAELFAVMAGPGRRPRLLASRQVRAPFSCGLLRPTVVLPAGLCEAPDEALRWVFAHELAHLRRRDAWSAMLFGLAQAVYFPVPWFWPLRRQARLCQEYLADAAAASAGGRPEDYAQFLLAWTAAPRPPVGACGVWARSSDLFWRVKTMLQSRFPLERRCPRRWSLAAACGLLSLAVAAAGFTLRASAAPAPEPNKEEPKTEQPKAAPPNAEQPPAVPDLPVPNLDDLFKNLPPTIDPNQVRMLREQMQRALDMQRGLRGFKGALPFNPVFPGGSSQDGRLGAVVEKPGDTLVDQLELPRDQGLIVRDVAPDSAAAKAGLKAHDILLEVDGKPVSSNPDDFRKALAGIKAGAPVDVLVMRKGKKETVKGLSLPEAKEVAPGLPGFNAAPPVLPPNFPNLNVVNSGNGVTVTTSRTNDQFTTHQLEPGLIITVTGKMEDGKAKVNRISIMGVGELNTYDSIEKAPEKYRDRIKNLVEMSEKGSVKAEGKAP